MPAFFVCILSVFSTGNPGGCAIICIASKNGPKYHAPGKRSAAAWRPLSCRWNSGAVIAVLCPQGSHRVSGSTPHWCIDWKRPPPFCLRLVTCFFNTQASFVWWIYVSTNINSSFCRFHTIIATSFHTHTVEVSGAMPIL